MVNNVYHVLHFLIGTHRRKSVNFVLQELFMIPQPAAVKNALLKNQLNRTVFVQHVLLAHTSILKIFYVYSVEQEVNTIKL